MTNPFNDKVYLSICSERTLQSNEKGFFMNFVQHVVTIFGEKWIKNVFTKLTTNKQRIRIIYEYEPAKTVINDFFSNIQEIYRKKSPEIAQAKRLEGEKLLKTEEKEKALMLFSQSVLRAPKTGAYPKIDCGATLSLALWGRSQAHIALDNYIEALKDIQLSLKENLPNIYRAEAYWKMGICYKALNEPNKANVAFSLADKQLIDTVIKKQLEQDKGRTFTQRKQKDRKRSLPEIRDPNTHHPHASKKLTIKENKHQGRFMVCNEQLKTGETIVVESPYAACLLPDMFGTNCHHCFDRLSSPIGCCDCASVAFCSIECRDIALESYHKYECKYLDLLIGSGMSILSHTALRMITQNPFDRSMQIYMNREKEQVYSLCTNNKQRTGHDFLQRTLMAAFLLTCLQKSGYFGEERTFNKGQLSEEEFRIGELLLYHLEMLQFNAHEIYETRHTIENECKRNTKLAYIGVAIYPTVALFNHDCYPSVTRYFVGKQIVIKTIRPLLPNEVVSENYGPIFTRRTLQQRQHTLSGRYWFNCKCKACIFNWPTVLNSDVGDVSKMVKCTNRNCSHYYTLPVAKHELTCPKCKNPIILTDYINKLKWCDEQYEIGIKTANSGEYEKAIRILEPAIDNFHSISGPPHKATHFAQETLRACYADSGNVYESSRIN